MWWEKTSASPEPFTEDEIDTLVAAKQHFWYFLEHVFILSYRGRTFVSPDNSRKQFEFGQIHKDWALQAEFNPLLCVMAPRRHLKTTVLALGFAMWQMFRTDNELRDVLYFSYKKDLADEKVKELRKLIKVNPFCRFWQDKKGQAETIIDYFVDWGFGAIGETTMKGEGILSATRGRHPAVVICDDILSDFANPLGGKELRQIERVFRQAIMSLPANPTDPLILVGTPQSYDDILYSISKDQDWVWLVYPAIKNYSKKVTQWPEKFNYDRLIKIRRQLKSRAFQVEYQLVPVRVADQLFSVEELQARVDVRLKSEPLDSDFENFDQLATYAGMDVGKQVHPSHVAVFLELPDKTLIQIYHTFLDHMKYHQQVARLNKIAKVFKLTRGYYDATFNVLEDRGLSKRWIGRVFTKKLKGDLVTLLEGRLFAEEDQPGMVLIDDERMIKQMASVTRDLQAITTADGHGDALWSVALANKAADDGPGIVEINRPALRKAVVNRPDQQWIRQLGPVEVNG